MSDAIEARLDEMAAKIAALEEEVVSLGKRIRKLRKKTLGKDGDGQVGKKAADDDED